MFIGFDYGTANCSVAIMKNGQPTLLPLEKGRFYIPSALSAPSRESVSEYLYKYMQVPPSDSHNEQTLRRAININKEEGIELERDDLRFGEDALSHYLSDPSETYYVKSPKSFLGATGLQPMQLSFFEDLVCAMMRNIKQQAQQSLEQEIEQAMIGRPIHFQGRGGEDSDRQAQGILARAAKRAGFKSVEFQYEPVAAGLEYEASLNQDKTVLVVDVGGGTTDCSLIQMGPSYRHLLDRSNNLLAHTGQRVGGNDLDIHLSFKQLMPHFGLGGQQKSGIALPNSQFWNPIAINDVAAQKDFYSSQNYKDLQELHRSAKEPQKLAHLLATYQESAGHQIVRCGESAKIALSEKSTEPFALALNSGLIQGHITQEAFAESIEPPLQKMKTLIDEILKQSSQVPDVVYMTGGSARSPILRQLVKTCMVRHGLSDIEVVGGDYFGSVTAGLARWAGVHFDS